MITLRLASSEQLHQHVLSRDSSHTVLCPNAVAVVLGRLVCGSTNEQVFIGVLAAVQLAPLPPQCNLRLLSWIWGKQQGPPETVAAHGQMLVLLESRLQMMQELISVTITLTAAITPATWLSLANGAGHGGCHDPQ